MRIIRTIATAIATVLFAVAAAAHAQPAEPAALYAVSLPMLAGVRGPQTAAEQAMAQQVLALLNAERARAGCRPLSINDRLTVAAQRHSEDMALRDYFSHTGSDGSSSSQRVTSAGYNWSSTAENIAAGHATAASVMEGWMASSGHQNNILNCGYTQIGIGYYYQVNDKPFAGQSFPFYHYWTQSFATPS